MLSKSSLRYFAILLFVGMGLAFSGNLQAQEVENNANVGLPENGTFSGSAIDNVQLNNGNLHIDIPLISIPGRGIPISAKYVYDNKDWSTSERCNRTTGECNTWVTKGNVGFRRVLSVDIGASAREVIMDCGGGVSEVTYNYTVTDTDGTKHHMLPDPAGGCGGGPIGTMYAEDGSGWTVVADPSTSAVLYVVNKDGLKITSNSNSTITTITDANGNQVTFDSTNQQITDTLGRVIPVPVYGFSYYDNTGTLQTITAVGTSVPANPGIICGGPECIWAISANSVSQIQSIQFPDGRQYYFNYEQTGLGEPNSVTLPTGGQLHWGWSSGSDDHGRFVASRQEISENSNGTWSYGYTFPTTGTTLVPVTVTVTNPDSTSVRHTFTQIKPGFLDKSVSVQTLNLYPPTSETKAEFMNSAGTVLKTVYTDYSITGTVLPIRETTSWDQLGLVSKTETDWDSFAVNMGTWTDTFTRRNPEAKREYDFGNGAPGGLVRTTEYDYLHETNSSYVAKNIVGKLSAQRVKEGTTVRAQSTFAYDNYGTGMTSTAAAPAPGHDYTNYGSGLTLRGNLTTTNKWVDTSNTWLATINNYDDLGNLRSTKDPKGNITSFEYSNIFTDSACVPAGTNTYAFRSAVVNAKSQRTESQYFSCTGQVAQSRDQNDINAAQWGSVFTYDSMLRLIKTVHPRDGGETDIAYSPTGAYVITTSVKRDAAGDLKKSEVEKDGLGRTKQTRVIAPECSIKTDTTYDSMGRVSTVSNPYCTTSERTYGVTTTQYDELGRVIKVIPPDGTATANNVSTVYAGSTSPLALVTTVTDQAGKTRKSYNDALGRLIQVDEPGMTLTGAVAPTPGTGSVTVSGTLKSKTVQTGSATPATGTVSIWVGTISRQYCPPRGSCTTVYNSGSVIVTVNGLTKSAGYNYSPDLNAEAASIASSIAGAFNSDATSVVTATSSGATIYFTAKAAGTVGNGYTLSTSCTYNTSYFTSCGFGGTASGSTLSGGADAPSTTVYDSGSVNVTLTTSTNTSENYAVSYGSGSTNSTIASALASSISAGTLANATASGGSVNITAKNTGQATNYSFATSQTYDTTNFTSPSFTETKSGATLTGGSDGTPGTPTWSLSTPYVTAYSYDVLDNLKTVQQRGGTTDSTQWRNRSFLYDSLSRLTLSSNPESGNISYFYTDSAGNLCSGDPSAVCRRTDARGINTMYTYNDPLNRLTDKAYTNADGSPDNSTTPVSYSYDQTSNWGVTLQNPIGRLTFASTSSTARIFSYDPAGRPLDQWTCLPSNCGSGSYHVGAQYYLDGNIKTLVYPSDRTINFTYDSAGRTLSAIDADGTKYADARVFYDVALGKIDEYTSGATGTFAGIKRHSDFNNRLQPVVISAFVGATQVFNLGYDFGLGTSDNGNVLSVINNLDQSRTQSFTYDGLNRLYTAHNGSTWGNTYQIDPWGNLYQKNSLIGYSVYDPLTKSVNVKNQFNESGYDLAGNMTTEGGAGYTYDGENRLIAAAGVTYTYDADGKRIKKSTGTQYVYGLGGEVLEETNGTGALSNEYIFFDGQRIARRDFSGNVYYYFSDHLGSTRKVVTAAGTVCSDIDYHPWGETGTTYTDTCPQNYKFTGKERDSESGLDYFGARYYLSSLARFSIPDDLSSGHGSDPQSWNRYAYAKLNPIKNVDIKGKCVAPATGDGQVGICVEAFIRAKRVGMFGIGLGDNRGPVANDRSATFRTQNLITVDLKNKTVSMTSAAGVSEVFAKGIDPKPGIIHSQLSNGSVDSDGNIHFTLTTFGLNGHAASGNPAAPQSWIEYTLDFLVDPNGTVVITGGKAKKFPSVSAFSYSNGNTSDLFEQSESGDVHDLDKPAQDLNLAPPKSDPVQEDQQRQCAEENHAACN